MLSGGIFRGGATCHAPPLALTSCTLLLGEIYLRTSLQNCFIFWGGVHEDPLLKILNTPLIMLNIRTQTAETTQAAPPPLCRNFTTKHDLKPNKRRNKETWWHMWWKLCIVPVYTRLVTRKHFWSCKSHSRRTLATSTNNAFIKNAQY